MAEGQWTETEPHVLERTGAVIPAGTVQSDRASSTQAGTSFVAARDVLPSQIQAPVRSTVSGGARGRSWECTAGDHRTCKDEGCVCRCHYSAEPQAQVVSVEEPTVVPPAAITTAITLTCPVCHQPGREGDKFCRADGARLQSERRCSACNSPSQPADQFCGECGGPLDKR